MDSVIRPKRLDCPRPLNVGLRQISPERVMFGNAAKGPVADQGALALSVKLMRRGWRIATKARGFQAQLYHRLGQTHGTGDAI